MCNLIFALFFLSPLTVHTYASLTLSFPLPLEFFLSYSFAHSNQQRNKQRNRLALGDRCLLVDRCLLEIGACSMVLAGDRCAMVCGGY